MNKKVMVVDDEHDVLESLKAILHKNNYEVITVDNGYDCIKQIEKGFQGVILMDLMMPKMDGWDTIHKIIKKDLIGNVCINIITGKGTKNHQRMGLLGSYVYDYLTKPIDIKKLVNSVNKSHTYLTARKN